MEVLIVNGNRYLINTDVSNDTQDETCKRILKDFPHDAIVEWDENVTMQDVLPMTVHELINKNK